jgi:hypothetical protein
VTLEVVRLAATQVDGMLLLLPLICDASSCSLLLQLWEGEGSSIVNVTGWRLPVGGQSPSGLNFEWEIPWFLMNCLCLID